MRPAPTADRRRAGYLAELEGLPQVNVRLASAGDIAAALAAGDIHLGVTGEDLLAELRDAGGARVLLLNALGFGRADLVVAAPKSWIDVNTLPMSTTSRTPISPARAAPAGATKYLVQTRASSRATASSTIAWSSRAGPPKARRPRGWPS